ncbi:MAG: hypothetical protein V7K88_08845 [Nostoc sp.]|uniref:hypothetical protein n=1 Tax=Nostoc sp. TaxID=1180 RepID=UPI002FFC4089
MSNSTKLIIWGLFNLSFFVLYYLRSKQTPRLKEGMDIALASGGLVTSITLFYQLIFSSSIKQILDQEVGFDITAFYLGAFAVGWISLQPIVQTFQTNTFVGKVNEYDIDTGTRISLKFTCENRKVYKVILTEELLDKKIKNIKNAQNFSQVQVSSSHSITPSILIGKRISVLDVAPIQVGQIQELRITQPEQLIIS